MAEFKIIKGMLFVNGKQVPFKASPNVGGKCTPKILVCHDTASGLNSSGPIDWLTNPDAKASAHFVVGRDGDITQLVSTDRAAWHAGKSTYKGMEVAGSVNSVAVGIEIVNPGIMTDVDKGKAFFSNGKRNVGWDMKEYGIEKAAPLPLSLKRAEAYWMSYTDEQLEAVLGIGHAVKQAYNISDVVAHWTVSPGRKVDTNPLFPLEEMKEAILKGTDLMSKKSKANKAANKPNTSNATVVVKPGTSAADKEAAAKKELDKTPGENKVVTVQEGNGGKASEPAENLDSTSPKADLPSQTKSAAAIAPTPEDQDSSVAPPASQPADPTPVAPPPVTPASQEIDKTKKISDEERAERYDALDKGLVTQELNIRAWPDSPNIVAVLAVGSYVDIERETKSQVTGSKWYKVRALASSLKGYLGKEKVIEGFVHSAYIQR